MNDATFPAIATAIKKLTGLHIEPEKYYLFEHRFADVMREYKLTAYGELLAAIENGGDRHLLSRVIEKITTHETRFFRDESIFDALAQQIIPEWKEAHAIPGDTLQYPELRIFSAACSTGQEVYSIAMILAEMHPTLVKKVRIIGSDISEESVAKARSGEYTEFELSRGLTEKYRKKYFISIAGGARIDKALLPAIEFRQMNLLADRVDQRFDIIFCRNVAYYFEPEARVALFEKMQRALVADGVLILGSAESLSGIMTDYVLREYGLARYYELNTVNVTMFARKK
ncbi:MAG: protein-glutamate O-methyltransferase CheR [Spirochaetes bacterium]|nr:protein-glutamate O-methyltransferase CheR [Spirochaetota bacterium]